MFKEAISILVDYFTIVYGTFLIVLMSIPKNNKTKHIAKMVRCGTFKVRIIFIIVSIIYSITSGDILFIGLIVGMCIMYKVACVT